MCIEAAVTISGLGFSIHIRLHASSLPWCGEASPFTLDDGPLLCYLGGQAKHSFQNVFCLCVVIFHRNLPERWKATEFKLFLLYTSPVALKDKIAKELYDNFLLLSVAIHLLANPTSATSFPLCDS